jgi:outer membrane lipoprotein-sorting protein
MRRTLYPSLIAAFCLALSLHGPALAAPFQAPAAAHFSETDKADLQRISAYLNTLQSVQGHFLQIAQNGGSEQGTFYLKKPGRVRFEYQQPNPNLIIADGKTVAVQNSALHTTDRYPLLDSPLRLLLSDNIDLANDRHITGLMRESGALSIIAEERNGPATGRVTLTFADTGGTLELRQWEVVDAKGAHTKVAVSDLHSVADIPPQYFVIQDLSPFKKG